MNTENLDPGGSGNNKPRRLGLALSGGGFRASFYHIGVLARMAERGILKHVESISTVSGGSIVGAAYYILLRELFRSRSDGDIEDQHYIDIVARLEAHFRAAVQKNLRVLTFANPWKNMQMALPKYSRSDAIGELYEKHIYQPLMGTTDSIGMADLLIRPPGEDDFHPMRGNPSRVNKVPVLILNAASLNSGHNWIFTATSMGEVPPRNLNFRDIDKKDRYRRVRYDEITTRTTRNFPLGKAVAASAGVPGLFPPMAVSNLYLDRRVQLVDGGVYDNQGIAGLLDPEMLCTDFVVSDASGQSDARDNPDTTTLPVLINASGIQGGRVREEMVNSLIESHPGHVAYFHLTRGLFARNIEFNKGGVSDGPGPLMATGIVSSEEEFGVSEQAQHLLAHIRTDLDSFTDVEAMCLEADGYLMSEPRLEQLGYPPPDKPVEVNWSFARFADELGQPRQLMLKQLEIGGSQFLKPYYYVFKGATDALKALGLLIVSLPLVAVLCLIGFAIDWVLKNYLGVDVLKILTNKDAFQQFVWEVAPAIYALLGFFILSKLADFVVHGSGKVAGWIDKILKGPMAIVRLLLIRVILPAIFALPVAVYVFTIDWYFIRWMGRLEPEDSD